MIHQGVFAATIISTKKSVCAISDLDGLCNIIKSVLEKVDFNSVDRIFASSLE
jgi:hypothetical protein